MQVERRILDSKTGEVLLSAEDRANPSRLIPDDMPAEFRALATANIRGDREAAHAAHELIESAEEIRSQEFRANAAQRLREVRAQF
jgi:hypothetical protein